MVKKTEQKKNGLTVKIPKLNLWMILTVILAGVLAFVLSGGWTITGQVVSPDETSIMSANDAANKVVNYINENLVQTGSVSLVSVEEISGVYRVITSYQGQEIPIHITKDGVYMYLPQATINLEETPEIPEEEPTQQPTKVEVSADDDPVKGSSDAPVTIIEFSDFQCPFCARFWSDTLPQIEREYIETGKVKLVFRDFPLSFHQNAQKAAEASECADEQGKFWEYHDKLFENQGALDVASLKQYASELGLDTEKFNSCLDNDEMKDEVQKDFQDGQSYGVSGTPAFFINGQLVSGAQPFSAFKQIIDSELSK